jgi:dTDP-L-rhamnose 4-epimerase
MKKVLVTGGAGFIGSYIVDLLIAEGKSEVYIFYNLDSQVHIGGQPPEYLNRDAVFIQGDVRNYQEFKRALLGKEQVYHLAASVGVGQSMYQISKYVEVNIQGTANLLDILTHQSRQVEKVLVAGSMSSYGEGAHWCQQDGVINPPLRSETQMMALDWELHCPICGKYLTPKLTPESKPLNCNSVYALSKKMQEEMTLLWGKAYEIPSTVLRFFNVYGPRQSLSNPYTGVCAIFLSRMLNNKSAVLYEDGEQTRDFIFVKDIARACVSSMNDQRADHQVFNVGNGKPISIKDIALTLSEILHKDLPPQITNEFRKGDVRHCIADIEKIKSTLDFQPEISFKQGMSELAHWTQSRTATDGFEQAAAELQKHRLLVKREK